MSVERIYKEGGVPKESAGFTRRPVVVLGRFSFVLPSQNTSARRRAVSGVAGVGMKRST
jgi:hypothetical protein